MSAPDQLPEPEVDAGLTAATVSAVGGDEAVPIAAEFTQTQSAPLATAMDLIGILSGIEEAAYTWDMATDEMQWESNVASVLGLRGAKDVSSGARFQFMIAAEHVTRRQAAFSAECPLGDTNHLAGVHSPSGGMPYRLQYRFLPLGRRSSKSIWLEDHGRWWLDEDGRPARARGVVRVLNDRHLEEQRLLSRHDQDELTGQLNRTRLIEALATAIGRAERTGETAAFLIASINNLTIINENFGFDIGDAVIASVGRLIHSRLRGGDTLGRYSSNKFGIIINDCGPGTMQVAAERFLKAVRQASFRSSDCPISSTISIGAALVPIQARTVPVAISRALQALNKARAGRSDTFVAYETSPAQELVRQRNVAIANDVASALDEGRMRLMLQPIVCSKTKAPSFYECLLRIAKTDGTTIGAGEFIEFAEQLGMSRLIDRRTLELAVDVLKRFPDITISLNVSTRTCADPEWLVLLHRLTGGKAHFLKRLIVEITETMAITDLDQTIAFVDTLKEMGCRVAIDDFGSGYTSFRTLKQLNCDLVKLDGAFVRNIVNDKADRTFVKLMSELGATFNMETVAEWVTDGPTAEIIADLGITYMQGFHFGRPFELDELDGFQTQFATAI